MNELDSRIAQEIDDEALFRLAEGEPHEFSPEYQEKMGRLYKKARVHPRRKMTPMRRIVAVAAIIAVLTGTTAAATFWEDIRQFFVTTFGEYVEIRTKSDVGSYKIDTIEFFKEWDGFWIPRKMKTGYQYISQKTAKDRGTITFGDGENTLVFTQWPQGTDIRPDGDGTVVPGIYVSKVEVFALEKEIDGKVKRSIAWTSGSASFSLYGSLSFESLRNIAESLVYVER